ncbi:unnamed protein product [Dibothriocephalus latus]|uniref:Laminin G domain-containing protein n=1 Tax=Dibothriocephalus latus TaxID=60516 RepID=A0A3P7RCQ6_DIBLA|nr:unnamed protein product [Dibothriocephalus latus]
MSALKIIVLTNYSPIVNFDGETVVMLDFERQMNTLTTHTDDIDIQFRTKNPDGPIFNAVSSVERQFLRVDLQGGQIKVTTNINRASNPGREQVILAGRKADSRYVP